MENIEKRGSRTAALDPQAFAAHLEKERGRVERTVIKAGLRLD